MGLHLFFFPNFPGATFIQGARFIPDSRVQISWDAFAKKSADILSFCNSFITISNLSYDQGLDFFVLFFHWDTFLCLSSYTYNGIIIIMIFWLIKLVLTIFFFIATGKSDL